MKKVLTILLCAVLTLSLIGIADAAGEQTILGAEYVTNQESHLDTYRDVTVSLSIDEDFTVTIPADFSLHDSGNGVYKHFDEVSVFIKKIDPNKYLTITIASADPSLSNETGWYLKHTENSANKLLFGIKLGQNVEDDHISDTTDDGLIRYDSAVISTKTIGSTVTKGMHFKLLSDVPTQSGVYENKIRFTVSMTDTEGAVYLINSNQNP